jgi:hypothetical protein
VVLDSDSHPQLRSLLPGLDITIESSGGKQSAKASIRVNGREVSANGSGMNVVALDYSNRVVASETFATGK